MTLGGRRPYLRQTHGEVSGLKTIMKQATLRAARAVDDWIHRRTRGNRRRVLFDGETQMHFSMFETICGAMQEDERLETYATCCWQGGLKSPDMALRELLGLRTRFVPYERAKWKKWDLYVSSCFDNAWFARSLPWVDTFHGVGEKWATSQDRLYMVHPLAKRYDRLFCPNERLVRGYQSHPGFLKTPGSACLTGMPRSDLLVWLNNPEVRASLRTALGVRDAVPLVLFSPTYGADGVLHAFGKSIIEQCLQANLHVAVKLHSCSYLEDPKFNCGVDWFRELEPYTRFDTFRHVPHANLTALMLAADVIVTDFGSAAVECSLTDRTLFFCGIKSQAERTGGDRVQFNLLCSAGGPVRNVGEFSDRLKRFLKGDSLNRGEQNTLRDTFFHTPGQATDNCLRIVYALLDLSYPATQVQSYVARKRQQVLQNPLAFLGLGNEPSLDRSP